MGVSQGSGNDAGQDDDPYGPGFALNRTEMGLQVEEEALDDFCFLNCSPGRFD